MVSHAALFIALGIWWRRIGLGILAALSLFGVCTGTKGVSIRMCMYCALPDKPLVLCFVCPFACSLFVASGASGDLEVFEDLDFLEKSVAFPSTFVLYSIAALVNDCTAGAGTLAAGSETSAK